MGTFINPIHGNAADPFIAWIHGWYYLLCTDTANDSFDPAGPHDITIRAGRSLGDLREAVPHVVYTTANNIASTSKHNQFYESPELWFFDGRWYVYYTEYPNRIHVLESEGDDPLGNYHHKAVLNDTIYDATILVMPDGRLYLVGSDYGSLVIEPLSNPFTVGGPPGHIAVRDQDWEHLVIEAPAALWHDGRLWMFYTCGSYNRNDYAVGALRYEGGDPTAGGSWTKLPGPLFTGLASVGVWCAGAACPFMSPDGKQAWFGYSSYLAYDAALDLGHGPRTIMAQPMEWCANGTPNMGLPIAPDQPLALPSGDLGEARP